MTKEEKQKFGKELRDVIFRDFAMKHQLSNKEVRELLQEMMQPLNCDEVRKILTRPVDFKHYNPNVQEALEHLLKCSSCFTWSFGECEKIRMEKNP